MVWVAVAFAADPLGVDLGQTTAPQLIDRLGKPDDIGQPDLASHETVFHYDGGRVPGGGRAARRSYTLVSNPRGVDGVVEVGWAVDGAMPVAGLRHGLRPPDHRGGHGRIWCDVPGQRDVMVAAEVIDGKVRWVDAVALEFLKQRPGWCR